MEILYSLFYFTSIKSDVKDIQLYMYIIHIFSFIYVHIIYIYLVNADILKMLFVVQLSYHILYSNHYMYALTLKLQRVAIIFTLYTRFGSHRCSLCTLDLGVRDIHFVHLDLGVRYVHFVHQIQESDMFTLYTRFGSHRCSLCTLDLGTIDVHFVHQIWKPQIAIIFVLYTRFGSHRYFVHQIWQPQIAIIFILYTKYKMTFSTTTTAFNFLLVLALIENLFERWKAYFCLH